MDEDAMSLITPQIEEYISTQSWIRRMFEAAAELKAKVGAANVFDFSLGNPDVPPPSRVSDALMEIAWWDWPHLALRDALADIRSPC